MSQSLSKLYTHIVFHTKYNQDLTKADVENELYAYLGGILKQNKSVPIAINGVENHCIFFASCQKTWHWPTYLKN